MVERNTNGIRPRRLSRTSFDETIEELEEAAEEVEEQPEPTPVAKPTVKVKSRAKFYTVATKLQLGLRCHIFEPVETKEITYGDAVRTTKVWRRKPGIEVVLNGTAQSRQHGAAQKQLVAGWAITKGVPADFWDVFIEQQAEAEFLINKLIIWWPESSDGEAQFKDGEGLTTGHEPLDPFALDSRGKFTDPRLKPFNGVSIGGGKIAVSTGSTGNEDV